MYKVIIDGFQGDHRIFDLRDELAKKNKNNAINYAINKRKQLHWHGYLNKIYVLECYYTHDKIILEL